MEVLQRTANRGSVSTGYDIDNSVKLQTAGVNSEFFNYTIGTTGDRTKGTVSMWIKKISFGTTQYLWEQSGADNESGRIFVRFDTDDTLRIATGSTTLRVTNRVFRDTSAWYHIVVTIDTTSGTADNRTRLYVNGVEETSFSTKNNFSQNDNTGMNFGAQYIGLSVEDSASYQSFNGYMAEVFGADGLVYAASDFGEFDSSGIWKPIDITGLSVGTNGFLMKFENAASMGAATSGHGFSVQNINQGDQATDVPSNNFCIMNFNSRTNSDITTAQGGTVVPNSGASICSMNASMGVSNGKWYWECRFANDPGFTDAVFVGIAATNDPYVPHNSNNYLGEETGYGSIGWYFVDGTVYNGTGTWTGPSYGNIIMFALDMDNLKLYFGKEGTWQNSSNPETNTNGIDIATSFASLSGGTDIIVPAISVAGGDLMNSMNFGGFANYTQASAASDENGYGTFEYAPPTGYYALCTKNLAEYG